MSRHRRERRSPPSEAFDAEYYRRFYLDPRTRVTTPDRTERLARFVSAYVKHLGLAVRRVLDVGCGLGYWRPVIGCEFPRAKYHGLEISEYLCRRHGWEHGSIVDYRADEPFDLVICQGVLQYLDARQASRALENLGRLCSGALYLEALTIRDWRERCDQSATDRATQLRGGSWYRRRLERSFIAVGGGVFLARSAPVVLFELEALAPAPTHRQKRQRD